MSSSLISWKRTVISVSLSCCLLLSGCSLMLTDYERPALPQADSFAHAQNFLGPQIGEQYWQLFNDAKLDALIDKALTVNYDLNDAYLNVLAARAQLGLTATNAHPSLNSSISGNVTKDLSSGNAHQESTSSTLGLSYEADLFGRLAAARRSAAENFQASAYDYWAMRLSIVEAVGSAYWQYAYAKEALALGEQDLKASERRLSLVQALYQAGAADGLDYDTARVNHLGVVDSLEQRRQQMYAAHNALCILLNVPPQTNLDIATLDSAQQPQFSLVLPAQLLSRRPDLQAAEARLRAALAGSDEAQLNFYPQFNLTASLTAGDGAALARLLSDPIGALGAAITFPFLNYNELSYAEDAALVELDRAKLSFVNTYLTALQETADAIDNVNYYAQAVTTMAQRAALAQMNYQRYEARYRAGACPLTDLLDASDTARMATLSLLEVKRGHLQALLTLMTAIGGDNQEAHTQSLMQEVLTQN